MQVTSQKHEAKFQPRTISFTIENQEEYDTLRALFAKSITVPDFVQHDEFLTDSAVTRLQNFMQAVHNELRE